MQLIRILLGLALSAIIGGMAYRSGSLSWSGALGAIITGTAVFGFGGLTWGLVLIAFFLSSSLLSHYREGQKSHLAEKFAKGHRRDLAQTLANGGFGALLAAAVFLLVDLPGQPRAGNPVYIFLTVAYFGAMASVTADTWATELGVLSRNRPRLITNGQPVPPGTSGGVTGLGTLAAFAGSTFIGLIAFLLIQVGALANSGELLLTDWPVVPVAAFAGLAGSFFDSLLGAKWQQIYWCPTCDKETERKLHLCGTATEPLRGWAWLDNDVVNFLASAVGGLAAGAVGLLFLL